MDCKPPGSCVCGILHARILERAAIPPPGDLPIPGTEPASLSLLHWQMGSFSTCATWEAHVQAKCPWESSSIISPQCVWLDSAGQVRICCFSNKSIRILPWSLWGTAANSVGSLDLPNSLEKRNSNSKSNWESWPNTHSSPRVKTKPLTLDEENFQSFPESENDLSSLSSPLLTPSMFCLLSPLRGK